MTQSTDVTRGLSIMVGGEEFKNVPAMPWLFVSADGELLSIRGSRVSALTKTVNAGGYEVINVGATAQSKNAVEYVHRIVARTWLPEVAGKSHVNHKDSDRTNNRADNLEWCTPKENAVHGTKSGRMSRFRKPVIGWNAATGEGRFFDSLMEAEKFGFRQSSLSMCLAGRQKTHMGYEWELYDAT